MRQPQPCAPAECTDADQEACDGREPSRDPADGRDAADELLGTERVQAERRPHVIRGEGIEQRRVRVRIHLAHECLQPLVAEKIHRQWKSTGRRDAAQGGREGTRRWTVAAPGDRLQRVRARILPHDYVAQQATGVRAGRVEGGGLVRV